MKYQVDKKVFLHALKESVFIWKTVTKATWNKYPQNKRRIVEYK